ncbi:MAG TPA: hypothetical protein PL041_02900 [Melioribacteraceae bacterium]|nr:hypothetical protein [Melioribacteraceae bacterium]
MEKEFIKNWISKNSKLFNKVFPDDFLTVENTSELVMPGKQLVMGDLFFGFYQVCSADGEEYFNEEEVYKAKYIVYSSKQKQEIVKIPNDIVDVTLVVKKYEKYLDGIIIKIKQDINKSQLKIKEDEAVRQIFNIINLIRF